MSIKLEQWPTCAVDLLISEQIQRLRHHMKCYNESKDMIHVLSNIEGQ